MFFERLLNFDPSLITNDELFIMVSGYVIVFLVLVLLFVVFNNIPRILNIPKNIRKRREKQAKAEAHAAKSESEEGEETAIPGEVNAAIAAALHMYFNEMHDEESTVLTIDKVSRRYSPWSSKIYSVMNYPKR